MAKVCSGYPRFVRHAFIEELAAAFLEANGLQTGKLQPYFFASLHAAEDILGKLGTLGPNVRQDDFLGVAVLTAEKGSELDRQLAKYIQHTGTGLSSREAEDLLIGLNPLRSRFPESKVLTGGNNTFGQLLQQWFEPRDRCVILPCKSGMNAFYAAFRAINRIQLPEGRKDWISVGWLYLDTQQILDSYLEDDGVATSFMDVRSTDTILTHIEQNGDKIAGLVLEAPTNPLVQTPDIALIGEACRRAGILTIMDPSLVSPQNVDLTPYCDVVCCSLTKYAAYDGDIMIGAVCIPMNREFSVRLETELNQQVTLAYSRDLARLGASLEDAAEVLEIINRNTLELAQYLETHPGVTRLHWAYSERNREAYEAIHRGPDRPGGVLTLELAKPIEAVYDALSMPKGPSFGTVFSLTCSYIHLAHFDLLQTDAGREKLLKAGIHANMIRLSVGTEPIEEIKAVLDRAL